MAATLEHLAALLLGLTFAWAGAAKLVRWREWRSALGGYGLGATEAPAAVGVPAAELMAAGLIASGSTRSGAALTMALLAGFSLTVVRARSSRGDRLPCGCFGGTSERDYRTMLARNALLAVLAVPVVTAGADIDLLAAVSVPSGAEIVPAGLAVAGLGLAAWTLRRAAGYLTGGEER
ncbi:MAG: hypothetical protein H0V60_03540 [Actinobacteria bacterium]|nr:hypothetical protein [Actinomycetota bacterium]